MRIGRPMALLLAGRTDYETTSFKVPSGFDMDKKPGRREWVRARLEVTGGVPTVHQFRAQGSGILSSMVDSDGLVELPEECGGVKLGDLLDFLPFSEVTR